MFTVRHNGIDLRLVSRSEFGLVVGRKRSTVRDWIRKGFLLPPAFEDTHKVRVLNGESYSSKFYLEQEAIEYRRLMRKYSEPRKGVKPSIEFVEEARCNLISIRERASLGDVSLGDYPLILEFENYNDLLKVMGGKFGLTVDICESIYKGGNILRSKENGSKKESIE